MFKNKEKAHLYISIIKSAMRIFAGISLVSGRYVWAGVWLIAAELFGVWEEIVVQ